MMVASLHSNRQLRTERYGDTEKGCQKPAVQHQTTDDANQKIAQELIYQNWIVFDVCDVYDN